MRGAKNSAFFNQKAGGQSNFGGGDEMVIAAPNKPANYDQ
jgi:hypothetical protein